MLVTVNDVRVVGPGQQEFGEIYVTTKPDELATPRGGTYINELRRDAHRPAADPAGQPPGPRRQRGRRPQRSHDRAGRLVHLRRLCRRGHHRRHLRRQRPPADLGDRAGGRPAGHRDLQRREPRARATPQTKYARLAAGIVDNLKSPDIVAVEEIQDNNGADRTTVTVAADQTLNKLTAAIKAAERTDVPVGADQPRQRPGRRRSPAGTSARSFLYNPDAGDPGRRGRPASSTRGRRGVDRRRRHRHAQPQPRPRRPDQRRVDRLAKAARRRSSCSRAARSSSWPTTSTPRAATRARTAGSSRRTGPPRSSGRSRPRCSTRSSSTSSPPTRTPTSCWPVTSTTTSSRGR